MEQFSFKPKKYFSYPILENNFQKFDYGLGITFTKQLYSYGYLGAGVYTNQFDDYDFNFSYANRYNNCNYGVGIFQRHGENDTEYNYDFYAKFGYKLQDHTFDFSLRGKDILDEEFSIEKHVDKCMSYQFEIDDYKFGAGLVFQPNGHTNGGVNINYRYADAFFGFGVNVEDGKIGGGASVMLQNDIYGYGAQFDTQNIGLKGNFKYKNHSLQVEAKYNYRNTENETQNLPKVGVLWSIDF